jgi:hypothetical protein
MINFSSIKKPIKTFSDFKLKPCYSKWYPGFIKQQDKLNIRFPVIHKPVGINIFAQTKPSETQHSKILCEILNPKGKHGLDNKLLEIFFRTVLPEIPFNDKETWIVTSEVERYDVMIRNMDNSIIIIIENKSNNAGDQPNQLYRYWYNGIYKKQSKLKIENCYAKIIYISPSYNKNPDEQTLLSSKSYGDHVLSVPENIVKTIFFHDEIDKWLEECINGIEFKSDNYYYLKQYKDFWRFYYGV